MHLEGDIITHHLCVIISVAWLSAFTEPVPTPGQKVRVPVAPGLGIAPDEAKLDRFALALSGG